MDAATHTDHIAVLADRPTTLGFKLAGVRHAFTCTDDNAEERLNAALAAEGVGVLVVANNVLACLSPKTRKRLETLTKPIVVAVPERGGKAGSAGNIAQKIKRAIGIELQ